MDLSYHLCFLLYTFPLPIWSLKVLNLYLLVSPALLATNTKYTVCDVVRLRKDDHSSEADLFLK